MIEWFDDLALGMRFKSGEVLVTKEGIKRFAAEFDPQPFHLDEAAAEKTVFKGLAASGWHTAAISMALTVEVRPFGPLPPVGPPGIGGKTGGPLLRTAGRQTSYSRFNRLAERRRGRNKRQI
jgi:acyl dehydratase